MKLTRKSTLFRGPEIEMSEEEYAAYKFGRYCGVKDGMFVGVLLSVIVMLLAKIFGL